MALEFKCKHCDEMIQSKFLKIGEIVECKKCGKKSTIPEDAKGISDADIHNEHTISDVFNKKSKESEKSNSDIVITSDKYPALKFISSLLKFIAILSAVVGVVIFFELVDAASYSTKDSVILIGLPSLMFSLIASICIYAFSELITLFIDIEKNTRK